MAVLQNRRGLWGSELTSRCGPSKVGELGACLLRHQAFQKPLPSRRLLKGLVHQRTGTQLPRDQKRKRVGDPTRALRGGRRPSNQGKVMPHHTSAAATASSTSLGRPWLPEPQAALGSWVADIRGLPASRASRTHLGSLEGWTQRYFRDQIPEFKQQAEDYGASVNAFDLQKFCEREWPTFPYPSEWPPEGSTDLVLAYNIQHAVFDNPGHPDQIPYIQIWIDILTDNPKVPMLPLRQVTSVAEGGRPFMVYVPFTTSDLYNWKNQNPSFSQNPQGLISFLESVFFTHQPTWDDCQQLLQTLFTSEKRERVKAEGRKLVLGPDGQSVSDPARLEAVFPLSRPLCDPNSDQGKEALDRYRQTLLRGVRVAARKPTNLSKVTETVQGPNESPAAFLECLCEAYRLYTPIDPEAPENRRAVNIAFVSQSAPDIRKKLQKLEGFEGKMLSNW
ncbi:hypothetical protein QTO34_006881 [Cnephaeus nilssonii]|uniref:Uncharacterized protein n=1 Tax=Cnephaeus nilssonii TaxID=3371016 RepID=A0AA40HJ78_CNENI|nr:hypothetical protein QTO34_006881 [Eptesicus nilssonii]